MQLILLSLVLQLGMIDINTCKEIQNLIVVSEPTTMLLPIFLTPPFRLTGIDTDLFFSLRVFIPQLFQSRNFPYGININHLSEISTAVIGPVPIHLARIAIFIFQHGPDTTMKCIDPARLATYFCVGGRLKSNMGGKDSVGFTS
jgi:hypothetical protein